MALFHLQISLAPITSIEDGPNGRGTLLCFYSSEDAPRNHTPERRHAIAWLILEFTSNADLTQWMKVNHAMAQIIHAKL